jgi:hypothetical protein
VGTPHVQVWALHTKCSCKQCLHHYVHMQTMNNACITMHTCKHCLHTTDTMCTCKQCLHHYAHMQTMPAHLAHNMCTLCAHANNASTPWAHASNTWIIIWFPVAIATIHCCLHDYVHMSTMPTSLNLSQPISSSRLVKNWHKPRNQGGGREGQGTQLPRPYS